MVDVRTLAVLEFSEEIVVSLDDLAGEGAGRMIAAVLRAEADEYVVRFVDELDENGHQLVVCNGRAREREVTVGSGTVPIRAPRVNDKRADEETGERRRFSSKILPAYARRSPKVTEVLPILYLRGLRPGISSRPWRICWVRTPRACRRRRSVDSARGGRPIYERFRKRHLGFSRYAYLFVDGVHVSVRLGEDDKLCLLVVIGVREDGEKELLAVEDGYRESTESWSGVLRDLKRRGLNCPKLLVGDGALGTWAALRDVFSEAGEQRCWVHKTARVLDALPKRLQSRAKTMLHEIVQAPTRKDAKLALETLRDEFGAKYPKALEKLDKDCKALTAFYDFPAEHWRHLQTTNPIESSFATVKLRTRVTKGAGSKAAALAMAYKLLMTAQERWRRFNGHELISDVLDGAKFKDGVKVTDDETTTQDEEVAA